APDDGGVQYDGDGQADAELFDGGVAVEDEAAEHEHHDRGGGGDHDGAGDQPRDDRAGVVLALVDVPFDPADDEHLVVHRQPEQDREHEQRHVGHHRHRAVEADQAVQPAPLEYRGQHAVGGADRQQVHHRGLDRDHHGAEGEQQQHEAERDHDQDLQQQLAGDDRGQIRVSGGGAADVGGHVGALVGSRYHGRAQRADQVGGGLVGRAGGGDRGEVSRGPGLVDLDRGDRRDPGGGRDVFLQRLQPRVGGAGVAAGRTGRPGRTARAATGGGLCGRAQ